MRSRAEIVDVAQKRGQWCGVKMVETRRAIVDREVEWRQLSRFHSNQAIDSYERSYVSMTHLSIGQLFYERYVGARLVLWS